MRTVCLSQTLQWSRQHKYKTRDISTVDCVIPRWAKCYVLTVEPFAVQYWALSIVLASPAGLASLHRSTVQSIFPYMIMLNVRRWKVGSTLTEDVLPPPPLFLSRDDYMVVSHMAAKFGEQKRILYKVWSIYV